MRANTTARRIALIGVFTLAALLALAPKSAISQTGSVEPAVKATYLYKFAPFVEWPANAFDTSSDPLVLCVVGADAVGSLVEEAVIGQKMGTRIINVRRVSAPARDARCHILYVAYAREEAIAAVLDSLRGTPVLTVTDSAQSSRTRGIINFVVQENRVRFEIDLEAASENRLLISSQLLSLALNVRRRGSEPQRDLERTEIALNEARYGIGRR